MSNRSGIPSIATAADLYAVAYQIETDAVDRYTALAGQMETHNNPQLAALFRDLARAEGLHAREIENRAANAAIAEEARRLGLWMQGESPESAEANAAHYLMTPRDALQLALAGEQRAVAFFTQVRDTAGDPQLKALAAELLEEEVEHVDLCLSLLQRYPLRDGTVPAEDPDPPRAQD